MKTLATASLPQQIAIALIGGYQNHISPRKGFSCAHRLLHGGESCSQYIKRLIAQKGLVAAFRASRQRFQACREANQILQARYSYHCQNEDQSNREQQTKRRQRRSKTSPKSGDNNSCPIQEMADCVDWSSALDCGVADCGVSGSDCPTPDCGSGLDCGVADCGVSGSDCLTPDCGSGLDCGALDCGSADCCSWG